MSSRKSDSRAQRTLRTLRTLRHLKPRQAFYFLLRRGVGQRRVALWRDPIVLRQLEIPCTPSIRHADAESSFYQFTFLNETLRFTRDSMNWNPAEASRLWRYNLHYFDFLRDAERSLADKSALIDSWIEHNQQGTEPAWEPYTASLRIVNWCLFFLSLPRESLRDSWLNSLYQQARWLELNLEWHILANHYFENIKAMLFAGFFFSDSNSARWLTHFQRELTIELAEQILTDGGHYERSPHYHCVVLQDCIELFALHRANPTLMQPDCVLALRQSIVRGLTFLQAIQTPDENIPLFNDSASLHPGTLALLRLAAAQLDIAAPEAVLSPIDLADSGYYGYKNPNDYFVIDCGNIGPAYQPGHTHCDFLSYVLMTDRQWLIVDSGVYEYQAGAMRDYVRSTAAHNVVQIDAQEQSEIWAEFRVGHRAAREYARISATQSRVEFDGCFNGFAKIDGGIKHRRRASLALTASGSISTLTIDDEISGRGSHQLVSTIHLHPDVAATIDGNTISLKRKQQLIATLDFTELGFTSNTTAMLEPGWYCPEFGNKQSNQVIRLSCTATLPYRFGYRINLLR